MENETTKLHPFAKAGMGSRMPNRSPVGFGPAKRPRKEEIMIGKTYCIAGRDQSYAKLSDAHRAAEALAIKNPGTCIDVMDDSGEIVSTVKSSGNGKPTWVKMAKC